MITLSEEQLKKLEKKGAKVRRRKAAKTPEPRPTEPAKPQTDSGAIVAAIAAESMEKISNELANAMKVLGARKPYPYKFTIKRDKSGKMVSVDADPVT